MAYRKTGGEASVEENIAKRMARLKSDLAVAQSHSMGRDRRVGQVMCYLSLMRSAGLIDSNATVTCTAAARQHFSSSRADGKQAAHFLPGQLRINRKLPWLLIPNQLTAFKLEGLFGDVDDLPADFNKADSAAEAYRTVTGLKAGFAGSCQIVVDGLAAARGLGINRSLVQRAFKDWIKRSRDAFQLALSKKEAKTNVPSIQRGVGQQWGEIDLNQLRAREKAMQRDWRYSQQVDFLKQYLANARPDNLTPALMDQVRRDFRV